MGDKLCSPWAREPFSKAQEQPALAFPRGLGLRSTVKHHLRHSGGKTTLGTPIDGGQQCALNPSSALWDLSAVLVGTEYRLEDPWVVSL